LGVACGCASPRSVPFPATSAACSSVESMVQPRTEAADGELGGIGRIPSAQRPLIRQVARELKVGSEVAIQNSRGALYQRDHWLEARIVENVVAHLRWIPGSRHAGVVVAE